MQNQSANHLSEVLGISYKIALLMVRQIQSCTKGSCDEIKLGDIIEFDELYLMLLLQSVDMRMVGVSER